MASFSREPLASALAEGSRLTEECIEIFRG
jgi:hypothetical protein